MSKCTKLAFLCILMVLGVCVRGQDVPCSPANRAILDELYRLHLDDTVSPDASDTTLFICKIDRYIVKVPASALPCMIAISEQSTWIVRYIEYVAHREFQFKEKDVYVYGKRNNIRDAKAIHDVILKWYEEAKKDSGRAFREEYLKWREKPEACPYINGIRDSDNFKLDTFGGSGIFNMRAVVDMMEEGVTDYALCKLAYVYLFRSANLPAELNKEMKGFGPENKEEERRLCAKILKWIKENRMYWDLEYAGDSPRP